MQGASVTYLFRLPILVAHFFYICVCHCEGVLARSNLLLDEGIASSWRRGATPHNDITLEIGD